MKLCRAKLDKMRSLLHRTGYNGEENEEEAKGEKMDMEDLLNTIQASEEVSWYSSIMHNISSILLRYYFNML